MGFYCVLGLTAPALALNSKTKSSASFFPLPPSPSKWSLAPQSAARGLSSSSGESPSCPANAIPTVWPIDIGLEEGVVELRSAPGFTAVHMVLAVKSKAWT